MATGISLQDGMASQVFDEWLPQIRQPILTECKDNSARAQGLCVLRVKRQYRADPDRAFVEADCYAVTN